MNSPAAIEVAGVSRTFERGHVRALDNVSLGIEEGEWVAMTGASGSGKSTLLHLIAALDRPTAGEITVGGRKLSERRDLDDYRRHEIGLVFQLHNLLPNLSALQNVAIATVGTGVRRHEAVERARDLLVAVGLGAREALRPPELSGGERQRVAIARALANGPGILLADEPTGSLDEAAAGIVLQLLARVREERRLTILMVTHDRAVAAHADRTITLRDGHVEPPPGRGGPNSV